MSNYFLMIIACELYKFHDYCVFDYLLFILVIISDGELHDYCAFSLSLQSFISVSELNEVHNYCVFDYFLFIIVTILECEFHKVHD